MTLPILGAVLDCRRSYLVRELAAMKDDAVDCEALSYA
jgi:hypothetical protein